MNKQNEMKYQVPGLFKLSVYKTHNNSFIYVPCIILAVIIY